MLNTLAIETSIRDWSIALLDPERVQIHRSVNKTNTLSRELLPAIQVALADLGWSPGQLDLIAVSRGPGSFTGLRVGITAAKTLAFGLGRPILACSSLEVIAAGVCEDADWSSDLRVRAVVGAERGDVVSGLFRACGAWHLEMIGESELKSQPEINQLPPHHAVLAGPALSNWSSAAGLNLAESRLWIPDPRRLGRLAEHHFSRGASVDPFTLVPEYARPSYADEKQRG